MAQGVDGWEASRQIYRFSIFNAGKSMRVEGEHTDVMTLFIAVI